MVALSKFTLGVLGAATLFASGAANAAAVITFDASNNGQQALPNTYQPLLAGYAGDGGALGITIGWGGTWTSSKAFNGPVTDHTPGSNGMGAVGYDGGAASTTITFSKAVTLPSFFYTNYFAGDFQTTFTGFLNNVQVASVTRNYNLPAGYTWLEENAFAGVALDSFTFSGPVYKQLDDITVQAVPEPATWAMMLMGFGMVGFGLRNRRKPSVRVAYA